MKSTSVKRGRPKKIVQQDTIESIAQDAKDWAKPSDKKKLATPPTESTAFLNKTYHYSDGGICHVNFSDCKAEPIVIKYTK